jgi:hypothetical protein
MRLEFGRDRVRSEFGRDNVKKGLVGMGKDRERINMDETGRRGD